MKVLIPILIFTILAVVWTTWFYRYTTNTAGGRFYKNDRWTGKTTVVEKNGDTHFLASSNKN